MKERLVTSNSIKFRIRPRINTLSRDYADPRKLVYLILDLCGTRRSFSVWPI